MNKDEFLHKLQHLRKQYFHIEDKLKIHNLTVSDIQYLYNSQNHIAEKIARFVLCPQDDAEIVFKRLIDEKTMPTL